MPSSSKQRAISSISPIQRYALGGMFGSARSTKATDSRQVVALVLLGAQCVFDTQQLRRDQQLGAERLETLGHRGVAHFQAGGLADVAGHDTYVEAEVAQHAKRLGART